MPLPLRLPPTEIHPIDSIAPLEGTALIVGIYIAVMALVWFFTRKKGQNP